jgi:glycosyltransferase involved in cell wall biosynthesis
MTEKRRVLLVDALSATNEFGVDFALALAPCVDLTVFAPQGSKLRGIPGLRLIEGFPEHFGLRSRWRKGVAYLRSWLCLARWVLRYRKDLVHVQFFRAAIPELVLYFALRPFLTKLVCTAHNAVPHDSGWWHFRVFKYWYSVVDQVHVMSAACRDALVDDLGVPPSKLLGYSHGNYERLVRRYPPVRARGRGLARATEDEVVVLFFGLIRPYKGLPRLLAAFKEARKRNTRLRLVIAGTGEPRKMKEVSLDLRALDVEEATTRLYGFQDPQTLNDLVAGADIIALPYASIYQSGALMLAMTIGRPIVATDIAGFREYIDDDRTGILCDTTDAVAFAERLCSLSHDALQRARLGAAARDAALTRFSWERLGHLVSSAYPR